MPPTMNFAACFGTAEREAPDDGAALLADGPPQRHRYEPVKVQQRAVAKNASSQFTPKPAMRR